MAEPNDTATRDLPELTAPRRVFKRKRNKGWITALKVIFPLIAVACVVYIVKWAREAPVITPTVIPPKEAGHPQATTDVTVKQVQYNGVDASNRPYSITAESASQPQKPEPVKVATDNDAEGEGEGKATPAPAQTAPAAAAEDPENIVNLEKLVADMTMSDGAWVALTADNGVYRRDAGTVDLSGNVTLFHDTGLTFETDAATVDLKNDWARGDQPVEGQNADGQLTSQGFEIKDEGKTILFTGRAYLKLYPKPANGGGS